MQLQVKVNGVEYEFSEATLTNREAMELEKVTGVTFGEFGTLLEKGSAVALTAVVWLLQKRDNPSLKFSEVEFSFDNFEVVDEEAPAEADAPAGPTEASGPEVSDS